MKIQIVRVSLTKKIFPAEKTRNAAISVCVMNSWNTNEVACDKFMLRIFVDVDGARSVIIAPVGFSSQPSYGAHQHEISRFNPRFERFLAIVAPGYVTHSWTAEAQHPKTRSAHEEMPT